MVIAVEEADRRRVLVGGNQDAVARRFLRRIGNRTTEGINAFRPVHGREGRGQQVLAIRPVEHEEVAVARSLHQQLARRAVKVAVHEHRHFGGIPVVRIVRRGLESPGQLAGVRDRARRCCRSRVVAGTRRTVQHRRRIAGADVHRFRSGS